MQTIAELAREASDMFERGTRENGDSFVTLKDGAPDWLGDLVHEAHGDMLPDDWRYQCIRSALDHIAESGADTADDLDDPGDFADGHVDVYNAGRVAWLASHGDRPGYCDEARAEFGTADDAGIMDAIGLGQYMESREVYGLVRQSLADRLEELEEEEDAAETFGERDA